MVIQGTLKLQVSGAGFTGLITPSESPQDWFIEVFATRDSAEKYSVEHGLILEEESESVHGDSKKRE